MLVLSLYALAAIGYEEIGNPGDDIRQVLSYADFMLCVAFLIDFVISLVKAPNRWRYLSTWGWIDLASSIPTVLIPAISALRWGRVARIVRVIRLLRAVRATKTISKFVIEKRAQSTFLAAALLSILFVVLGSIAILQIETAPGGNIHTGGEALWWAFETVTSVDYGDVYPVTTEGRLIAALLVIVGAGLFGALAGSVALWFLAPSQERERKEIAELREDIAELKRVVEASRNDRTV
jgi:voltage-gated potassium channel